MPRILSRVLIGASVALLSLSIAPAVPTTAAADHYTKDVYFTAGYERQIDNRTCSAASTAMMMNFLARKDLRLGQMTVLRYAQPRDALNDRSQRGSDPLGWSLAATHFSKQAGSPTTYVWRTYRTEKDALKAAARSLAKYGKPVGLLAMNGRHAVVMTGFQASRDPNKGDFGLIRVTVSDPYGARRQHYPGYRSPLSKYLELDASRKYDKLWFGKFIIIAPTN
jgi:hypothetical protein